MAGTRKQLTRAEAVKVGAVLIGKADTINQLNIREIGTIVKQSDCGVKVSEGQLRHLLKDCGLTYLSRRGERRAGSQTMADKLVTIAKAIRELAQAQGHELSQIGELNAIIGRKAVPGASETPTEPEETEDTNGTDVPSRFRLSAHG